MRSEYEWLDFLKSLDEDRRERATTGKGRLVHPREEIMVPTQERRTTNIKGDVDDRIPSAISLAAADEILEYRPLRAAQTLTTPLLVIGVEGDATTPTDHAVQIYEAARGPAGADHAAPHHALRRLRPVLGAGHPPDHRLVRHVPAVGRRGRAHHDRRPTRRSPSWRDGR